MQRIDPLGLPGVVPQAPPVVAQPPPPLIVTGLKMAHAVLSTVDGGAVPAIVFQFDTPRGPMQPVAMPVAGMDPDEPGANLAEVIRMAQSAAVAASEVVIDVEEAPARCGECGSRIFGDLVERGVCLSCRPESREEAEARVS